MSDEKRPITAESVSQVRNATDMPMMEAKRFLQHYNGDVERAIQAGLNHERLPAARESVVLAHPDIEPAPITKQSIEAVMSSGVGMTAARTFLARLSGDVLMAAGYATYVNKAVMIRGEPGARERWNLAQAAGFKASHFVDGDVIVPIGMAPDKWREILSQLPAADAASKEDVGNNPSRANKRGSRP